MSQATDSSLTARVRAPQVLERERAQNTDLALWRDGALVAPLSGTYTLLSPAGALVIDAQAVVVAASVATYSIPALSLPSTLGYGEGYTEQWALVDIGSGLPRTFTRECSIAKFQLAPSITDLDLLAEYPDLLELLGAYNTHLQSWIDEAFVQFLNDLYSLGEWPDVIVTRAATRKPLKERAYFLIYKFLFSKQPNAGRFEVLMNFHQSEMNAAFKGMSYRVDRDQDGTPDGMDRHSSTTVVHRNAAPRRILRRSTRW
jgi:hypothetical protein